MNQYIHLLPKIPGYHSSYTEPKCRSSRFQLINGTMMLIDKKTDNKIVDTDVAAVMLAKGKDITGQRNWLAFDKEVLCFDAYYENETSIRNLKILYYLVDEKIQVNEPKKSNSGMIQGVWMERQLMRKPNGSYYKIPDLIIGETVIFHGKPLKIIGVNSYTRDFFMKMGIQIKENLKLPPDPYFVNRKNTEMDYTPTIKSAKCKRQSSHNHLSFVLRFKGFWDERCQENGELHSFDVLYFLEDDTMQIIESKNQKCEVFLKRQKLPMNGPYCLFPGQNNRQNVLNVITNLSNQTYYSPDKQILTPIVEYYHCKDLYIGATINLYGRSIVLTNCDELTKNFYKEHYNLENFNRIIPPKTLKQIKEDKLQEQRDQELIKNRVDILRKKIINKHPGLMFSCEMKMNTNIESNKKRRFNLKYYMDNKELTVYEYREINSGLRGGMFHSKRSISKNQQKSFNFLDLVVGSIICIDEFEFIITDVHEDALKFMIDNPKEFPHSDIREAINKTRDVINKRYQSLNEFQTQVFQDRELVNKDEFREVMDFEGELDPHIGALLAFYFKRQEKFNSYTNDEFRCSIQTILQKARFTDFDGLKRNIRKRRLNSDEKGYITFDVALKAIKSNKLPFSKEIMKLVLDKFTDVENNRLRYEELIDWMDYISNPTEIPSGLLQPREVLFNKPLIPWVKVKDFVDRLRME